MAKRSKIKKARRGPDRQLIQNILNEKRKAEEEQQRQKDFLKEVNAVCQKYGFTFKAVQPEPQMAVIKMPASNTLDNGRA